MLMRSMIGAGLLGGLLAAPVSAEVRIFSASLSGAAEATPNASPATGSVLVTVDTEGDTMRVQSTFAGLLAPTTVAHIHCCTATAGTGVVSPATTTPTFAGFPAGLTSGSFDATFNMDLSASYNPAFLTAQGGSTETAFDALVAGMAAGTAYFNIHSTQFGGGEIRGFLAPIPEPETYALMLVGLAAVGVAARRRRTA